jgi:hypothetical protein
MGKASSSKKVARAARAGGRRSAARQRNLLFPGAIGAIVVLGVTLVAVAADDYRSEAAIDPVLGEHWHAAVGFRVCDEFRPDLPEFESRVGIHTHGDGVIHIHPSSAEGTGENATLGKFLDGAGVTLTDTELRLGDKSWSEADEQCDGKDAELVVAQWKDVESTDDKPALIRRDFDSIRFLDDGEGYTIAFVPEGTTDIPKPRSADRLTELGSADGDDVSGATSTTAGAPSGTTAPGATTPAPPTTSAPATTVPAG